VSASRNGTALNKSDLQPEKSRQPVISW